MTRLRFDPQNATIPPAEGRALQLTIEEQLPSESSTVERILNAHASFPPAPTRVVVVINRTGRSTDNIDSHHTAAVLRRRGLATVLLDLFTDEERRGNATRLQFDIGRLTERIAGALEQLQKRLPDAYERSFLFASGSGAAAGLATAASHPALVGAIATRGGRPELVGDSLDGLQCPVLLIRGSDDHYGLAAQMEIVDKVPVGTRFETVRGTDGLFENPVAVHEAARIASDWFHEKSRVAS